MSNKKDFLTLTIHGEKYQAFFTYGSGMKWRQKWNRYYFILKQDFEKVNKRKFIPDQDVLNISDWFFFRVVWDIIDKKYFWPFRKPFRSMKCMVKQMGQTEGAMIVSQIMQALFLENSKYIDQDDEVDDKKKQ
jgi:hypothetical protein